MKLFRILYLLFAVILFTTSCSHTNKQLLQTEQLIETAPDSAMAILQKYNYNSLTDKDKALYGLLYTEIQLSKKIILQSDSLINFSIVYYEKENEPYRIASCYLYKGRLLKYAYRYEKAMDCYLKALDNTDKNTDKALLGRLNFDMGDINSFQSDFSLARLKYLKAYNYYIASGLKPQAFYARLNIGRTYYLATNYLKAEKYYRQIFRFANDSVLKGALYQEMGQNFYENMKFDSALIYLQLAKNYPYLGINKAIRFSFLSRVYFDLKNYDSAFYYAKETFNYQPEIRLQRESFRIMTNCEFIKGHTENVTKYMNKYVTLGDSIYLLDKQTKGSYIETMHNTQKEAAKSRSWIWYLSIFMFIIIVFSILIYVRKHKKAKYAIEQSKESYSLQKADLRKDLLLKKRSELLTNIERIKTEQKQLDKEVVKFDKRVKNMYNELLQIQDADLFFHEMDKSYNNIVTKLKTNAPDIKEKELIWCCLQLLDVPIHDMLILLDYESVNSLKRMKGRLAPKLGLINAGLLNDYLLNLSTID